MVSIKRLIFEREVVQTGQPGQSQTPAKQQPQQSQQPGSARQKELAPYREAARMLVNISKNIDPKSPQATQIRAKLKPSMQQFLNVENMHDDAKLNFLFNAIEDEAKIHGLDERALISILQIVGGSVGSFSKRLLQQNYNTLPVH